MTKVNFNGSVKGWRGRMGDLIFRLLPNGTSVVSRAPSKKKFKFSEKQLAHQENVKQAAAYGREAAKVQPIYAELAARIPMNTAYNLAFSDWFESPVIPCIERRAGRILVQANDNILVTKVHVTVLDEEGSVLETGDAIRGEGDWWEFASNVEGKTIMAEARDLPGHVTKAVL
jgi:hypothetical protein